MRGKRGRKVSYFSLNHRLGGARHYPEKSYSSWLPRQSTEQQAKIGKVDFQGNIMVPDFDNNQGKAKLLRPKSQEEDLMSKFLSDQDQDENFVCNRLKLMELFNGVLKEHGCKSCCGNAQFCVHKVLKKGVTCRLSLSCENCDFISSMYPLYIEVSTPRVAGCKKAAVNLGLQVGLQETAIGGAKLKVLLSGGNIYSPAESTLQRNANTVCDKIVDLNRDDMKDRLCNLKEVQRLRSVDEPNALNLAFDGRYPSVTFAGRHKLGQNCSQAVGVARETITDTKQVIGVSLLNKLCPKGTHLRHKGFDVSCPNGHPGKCTANISANETITERKMAKHIAKDIAEADMVVKYMVTDGDSTSALGMTDVLDAPITRQADPVHRGQTQIRYCNKATFSDDMFPRVNNMTTCEVKKLFALDLKNRSSLVLQSLFVKFNGDVVEIGKRMIDTVDSILSCYGGNCSRCRYQVTGCTGGKTKSWWVRSVHLGPLKWSPGSLVLTNDDRYCIRSILELKLSIEALNEMKTMQSTNTCEAFNRALSSRMPKNVTYPRNAAGRLHATAHAINNNIGSSLLQKAFHVGTPVGPKVARELNRIDRKYQYKSRNQKKSRHQRLRARRSQVRSHLNAKISTDAYQKGREEPKPNLRPRAQVRRKEEHTYARATDDGSKKPARSFLAETRLAHFSIYFHHLPPPITCMQDAAHGPCIHFYSGIVCAGYLWQHLPG